MLGRDLDAVRSFIFSNVSRDRGLRAVLEAIGSVLVLFYLSWRLGPVLAGVIAPSPYSPYIVLFQSILLGCHACRCHCGHCRRCMDLQKSNQRIREAERGSVGSHVTGC
jgi:hypothetical protein